MKHTQPILQAAFCVRQVILLADIHKLACMFTLLAETSKETSKATNGCSENTSKTKDVKITCNKGNCETGRMILYKVSRRLCVFLHDSD